MSLRLPLAAAAAVALLGGCDSGGGKPSPAPLATQAPRPGPYEPAVPPPAPEAPPPAPASDLEASPSPSAAPGAGAEDPQRKAVKAYFARMDQVLPTPRHAITGEIKNADIMLINAQKRAEGVRKVEVPEPCAEHHRRTLELLEAAISLADRMRVLRDTQDKNALLAFGTDRASLDEQERQIDALAAEIKQVYP